jgi:hypothetical protein
MFCNELFNKPLPLPIATGSIAEIINNTRGGIALLTSGKKKECGYWGANSSPGCVLMFPLAGEEFQFSQ